MSSLVCYGDHISNAMGKLRSHFRLHYDVINWSSVCPALFHSYQISLDIDSMFL